MNRPTIQALESRQLLSAAFDPATRLLSVNGTAGDDVIDIEWVSDAGGSFVRVTVNGVATTTAPAGVLPARVIVNAAGGNDSVVTRATGGAFDPIPVEFYGGDGDDRLEADFGTLAFAHGGAGDDTLLGGAGNDSLVGGIGDDELSGGAGRDTLDGDDATDFVSGGGNGDDELYGGADDDTLVGGGGDDLLRGQDGDDKLVGDPTAESAWGHDVLDGDRGVDTVDYTDRKADLSLTLDNAADDGAAGEGDNLLGVEVILSGEGNDQLSGDDYANTLVGGLGGDRISGGGGEDRLDGSLGNDDLFGDRGNDTLLGGIGRDALYGGRGDDLLDGGAGRRDFISGGFGVDTHDEGLIDAPPGETLTLTGTLVKTGVSISGGTGWILKAGDADRDWVEVEFDGDRLPAAERLAGQRVTVSGKLRLTDYVESKGVRTLTVRTIGAVQ